MKNKLEFKAKSITFPLNCKELISDVFHYRSNHIYRPSFQLILQELICYKTKPLTCQYNSAQINMKQGFQAQTESTLSLTSRHLDASTTGDRNQSVEANSNPRINYPNLQHLLANNFSETIKRDRDILTQVIQVTSTHDLVEQQHTDEKKKVQKVGQETTAQQLGLLNLNGRLRSLEKETLAHSLLKLSSSQEIKNNQQIKQKEYQSDSKPFSKIKAKVSYESETEVKQNPECFKDKLLKEIKVLEQKINRAEKELEQKQTTWAQKQSSLNQQLQEEDESMQKYIEQLRQLEAQNKFLTREKEKREKQQEERALFYKEKIEKSASERIIAKEMNKKTQQIDYPKLTNQKHSSSNIESQKTKAIAGSQKHQVAFFKLLNQLKKQLSQTERLTFRSKIGQYLCL